MVSWCFHLGNAFPEIVARVIKMPLKGVFAFGIVDKFLRPPHGSLFERFPKECCSYVVALLKAEDHPLLHDQYIQLHDKFKAVIPGTGQLQSLEELLYLRGWKKE